MSFDFSGVVYSLVYSVIFLQLFLEILFVKLLLNLHLKLFVCLNQLKLEKENIERIRICDTTSLTAISIQYWIQDSPSSLSKKGIKSPPRCSRCYFTMPSRRSIKKKTKKLDAGKLLS